ncbi:isochorismatase family protein [Streptomyces oceani]|uniref:Carbamoylsarcosine amidase n=1 Tax=Streptomyces oceani TaxID=1075402 RepID=A0A1E7KKF6_9ACTN|nr:isochorismatase family protein [Streptomyces oceani]OEV04291.1 carbamoylsarcosine amidase [Streptomyces oceani]
MTAEQPDRGRYGQETDQVYERAGFGARVRRGVRPALVVVDLTRGFTEDDFASGSDLTQVVRSTSELVDAARPAEVPVIYTVISYTPAEARPGPDGSPLAWLDKATGMRAMVEGSEAVDLDPRLPREPVDHLVAKKGASAFFGTSLAALLASLRCDTVLVCGATTSGCVRATAVDAVQSGFPVLVPRDCAGDRARGPHDAALFDIDAKYGDVISQADALGYLRGLPPRTATGPNRPTA